MLDTTIILKLLKTNLQPQHATEKAWQAAGSHSYYCRNRLSSYKVVMIWLLSPHDTCSHTTNTRIESHAFICFTFTDISLKLHSALTTCNINFIYKHVMSHKQVNPLQCHCEGWGWCSWWEAWWWTKVSFMGQVHHSINKYPVGLDVCQVLIIHYMDLLYIDKCESCTGV